MSGVRLAYERHSLEWLLASTPRWVQATLVRESPRWPAPLRGRVVAHHRRTGLDVDDILEQFGAWLDEREQRLRERTSLIG